MNRLAPLFSSPRHWVALASAVALAGALPCPGQTSLVGDSPFAPSGSAAATGKAADQDYELAGSSSEGSNVAVCIFEKHSKRSEWISVGGTSDGIRVISFDSTHDRAVVIVGGQRKEISMRVAAVASLPSAAPMRTAAAESPAQPALVPVGQTPPPAVTGTPEQQQREARMLVSDLLEIGVQQRKAYQDAKLKAAQGNAAAPAN